MKKLGLMMLGAGVAAGAIWGVAPQSALAIAPFKTEFEELYIVEEGGTPEQTKLAEAYDDKALGGCFACHGNPKELGLSTKYGKTIRNAYGVELAKLLNKEDFSSERRSNEPEAVKKEIQDALKKVADMPSAGEGSPTFGELMAKGELPSDGKVSEEEQKRAKEALEAAGKTVD